MTTGDKLNNILKTLDVQVFFEAQGIRFNRQEGKKGWYVDCPFCANKGKLHISKNGLWKCYKCEEKGNAITLYSKLRHCSNGEAVRAIKEFLGIDDTYTITPKKTKSNPEGSPRVDQTDVLINFPEEGLSEERDPVATGPGSPTAMEAVQPRDIYHRFVEVTTLLDAHKEELRTKRGFTDATIERLAFRSCGPHIAKTIERLRDEFADESLKEAGFLVEVNGTLAIDDQFLGNRVLIPYMDERGSVYHLRPHKLGMKGKDIHPYARLLLDKRPEHIVLTEGEFKAVALMQWGIPALALPGISSFGGKHFERLVYLLREFDVKHVTVIFDNEDKSNPAYSNFKERPEDRYDTQFWSYMMAYKLGRQGFAPRVGWLPDSWRKDTGKTDWDGALAAGHSLAEVQAVIREAKAPSEFLESLPEEAQRIVRRKITRQLSKVNIRREFNRYVATRYKNGEQYDETITNFVINIRSSFFTPDGVIRNVELVNEYGETSDTFSLDPGNMAGLNEFKKFCFGKGNYVFEGKGDDLTNVWKFEFLRDTGDLIYMPDRIGLIEDDLWLFGNLAIKKGKIYKPGNDGIVWIDNKGYKPQSLHIGSRGETIEDAIPALSERSLDIADVARKLKEAVGGYEAYMGIGWVIATIFSKDIFEQYKCIPILFPHGKRESGKSTFMRWIMAFFGIETEGVGIAETTQNFIARALSYYSSLGCWFDEYRNEPRVIQKDGFFRSAYNRQLSGKGTATAFQARGFSVHAAVAVSGEELPRDNGLFTRCIPLQMSSYRRNREWFDYLNRQAGRFSGFIYWLLTHYEELRPKILSTIAELKEALIAKDVSDRTAENWAICAGAFDAVVLLADDEFIRWVEQTCQEMRRAGEEEHMLSQFWDDINYLVAEEEIGNKYFRIEGDRLYVWFQGLYEAWAIHYRKKTGREPFDRLSIQKYLAEEPYVLSQSEVRRINNANKRTWVLVIDRLPESVKEIINVLDPMRG